MTDPAAPTDTLRAPWVPAAGPVAATARPPAPGTGTRPARLMAPLLLAAALALPLTGCGAEDSSSACPTLPPGAEASPLPTPQPCEDADAG